MFSGIIIGRTMLIHNRIIMVFLFFAATPLWALNCKPLEPLPRLNEEIEAKLNLDTGKLLKQLLGSGEVSYRQATQDTLKNYPKSDQANVCERMIYLACTLLDGSQEDSAKKVEVVNNLMQNCNSYRMEAVRSES
jgi:hypothetical protein